MRASVSDVLRAITRYLPIALFAWSVVFAAFVYGFLLGDLRLRFYNGLEDTRIAVVILWEKVFNPNRIREAGQWSDIAPSEIHKHRVVVHEPVDDDAAFLLTGGQAQFLEYCPEHGCAAVILDRNGGLIHAYPFRPDELTSKRTLDLPYGEILHDDAKDTAVVGLAPLPNGDLIVVYDFVGTTPYGGGVARMDKTGHLRWYRRDYSDHWPTVTPENEILVISHRIGPGYLSLPLGKEPPQALVCPEGLLVDIVRVLDFDGNVKEEIPVFDALFASPYRSRVLTGMDPFTLSPNWCDPVHSNSVVRVGPELAARFSGADPNDLLLSLRNLNALAIIGGGKLKHFFTGSFIAQHSAQIVPGGKIVLFDNLGSSPEGGPSRVVLFDPVNREERTLFPNHKTPRDLDVFSRLTGNVSVSRDGTRALFVVASPGKAYEIGLADGRLLTTFNNLHDVSRLPQFADDPMKVRYFTEFGVYYVPPQLAD